jgi:hypothetical protein
VLLFYKYLSYLHKNKKKKKKKIHPISDFADTKVTINYEHKYRLELENSGRRIEAKKKEKQERINMPSRSFGASLATPKLNVAIDTGNPFLNVTVDGFLKIGTVRIALPLYISLFFNLFLSIS